MRHSWMVLGCVIALLIACNTKKAAEEATPTPEGAASESVPSDDASAAKTFRASVSAMLAEGQYKKACVACRHLSDGLAADPDVPSFCDGIISKALSRWEAALLQKRDKGSSYDLDTKRSCAELQQQSTTVSADRSDAIATLCQELALGDDLKAITGALDQALKSERPRVPALCGTLVGELKKLGSAYALQQSKKVDEDCHQRFPADAVKVLMAKLAAAGDQVDTQTLQRCFDVQQLASRLSAKEQESAATFCAEIQIRGKARQAIDDASRNVKEGTNRVPRTCGRTMMALAGMSSPQAKTTRADVIDACYVKLGVAILQARLPKMEFGCDPDVRTIVVAVKTHRITNAALTSWVQKALPKCGAR